MFDYVGLFSAAIRPHEGAVSPVYSDSETKLKKQFEMKPALYYIAIGDKERVDHTENASILEVIGEVKGGRPSPRDADQPEEFIPCDVILMAVGQRVDSDPFVREGVPANRGTIVAGPDGSVPGLDGVFSGGDCVSGPATVILAIEAGKVAAASIDEYLGCHTDISANLDIPPAPFRLKQATGRIDLTEREASWRKNDFELMENCMSEQEMAQECSRCLRCDHFGYGLFRGGRNIEW